VVSSLPRGVLISAELPMRAYTAPYAPSTTTHPVRSIAAARLA
jgi:hypothetical protein